MLTNEMIAKRLIKIDSLKIPKEIKRDYFCMTSFALVCMRKLERLGHGEFSMGPDILDIMFLTSEIEDKLNQKGGIKNDK